MRSEGSLLMASDDAPPNTLNAINSDLKAQCLLKTAVERNAR